MPGGDTPESGGDTTDSEEATTRCRVRTTESGGRQFWAVLDNFTCKSRTNPAEWSDDEHGPWMEALTKWRWDPLDGDKTFWAYLALIRLGHSPTKPFFKHVFSKLKRVRCLRGVKKQELFDKLSLPHLERLRPHLNSDEVLSMAIHFEAHEWVYDHPNLGEGSTAAQARAGQEEAEGSPTASTASTRGTSQDHTGSTPPPAAGATGEGEGAPGIEGRGSGDQGGRGMKREATPGPGEQRSKKRRLAGVVKKEEDEPDGFGATGRKTSSLFIYDDDDSDVL